MYPNYNTDIPWQSRNASIVLGMQRFEEFEACRRSSFPVHTNFALDNLTAVGSSKGRSRCLVR